MFVRKTLHLHYKYINNNLNKRNMETKINVRGTMRKMNGGDVLEIPRKGYRVSSIRSTATLLQVDYGQAYSITVSPEKITVTRVN
jgi:hypothetical protein